MPLTFTGQQVAMESGTSFRAEDQQGRQVAVHVSHEAMHDHSLDHIEKVASGKYDAGLIEANGTVAVRTADYF